MAVIFSNATGTAGPVSSVAKTLLHTAVAGSVLIVGTHSNEATSISAINSGVTPLTRLGFAQIGVSVTELWGLTAPPTGVNTLVATLVGGANSATFCMIAATYTGQRTTATPFGGVSSATPSGTVANLSISSTSTNLVAIFWGISANATVTLSGNQTNRLNRTHSTTGRLVLGDAAGLATLSVSASSSVTGSWGLLSINIIESAGAASVVFTLAMTGCGR